MPKVFPSKRFNAKVTIEYGKPVTKTLYGRTEEYIAHKLIVNMVRLPDDTWEVLNVSAAASLKAVRKTTGDYCAARRVIDDIDITPDIKKTVAHARKLVVADCKGY